MEERSVSCVKCSTAEECIFTNQGWMCRTCFHRCMKGELPFEGSLYTLPDPDLKVFVIMDQPGSYVTIAGTLYAFYRRQDADEILQQLRMSHAIFGAFVEEVEARFPLAYVLAHPELRLLGVKARIEGEGDLGPHEVPMPKL